MLKQKAEIVIDENNRLHEQLVSGIQDEIGELDGSQSMIEVFCFLLVVSRNIIAFFNVFT